MSNIRRQKRKIVFQANRRNQHIFYANVLITANEVCVQSSGTLSAQNVEWQYDHDIKQILFIKPLPCASGSIEQFICGNRRHVTGRCPDYFFNG